MPYSEGLYSSLPGSPAVGELYYATDRDALYGYVESAWKVLAYEPNVPKDSDDLAVWALDDTSGTTVTNTGSASSSNLTASGNVTLGGAGPWGRSGRFYGGIAKGAASVQPAYPLTVSCWVHLYGYPDGTPTSYTRLVCRPVNGYSNPYMSFTLTIDNNGLIAAEVNSASSGTGAAFSVAEPVTLGEWHHVGASYDGTTLRLYLDGTEVGSLSRSVTMGYTSGTNDVWCLGGNPAASEENVKGRMKDVRIAQVARDAAWFRQVYQRGRGTWNG